MADVSNRRVERQYRQNVSARNTRSYYKGIDGNTARQLNAVPKRREREVPRQRPNRRPEKQPAKMAGIDGASFAFMVCVLGVVMFVAFAYIHTQNQVRSMKKEIVSMQTEIEEQQEKNKIKYNEILASVDLAEIYKRATKKLHMVMADGNKVYKYKNKKSDMVKQYGDVPGPED
ncbi:MAG: septum formation initiator family protein [Lachnospiraceae bacterium]